MANGFLTQGQIEQEETEAQRRRREENERRAQRMVEQQRRISAGERIGPPAEGPGGGVLGTMGRAAGGVATGLGEFVTDTGAGIAALGRIGAGGLARATQYAPTPQSRFTSAVASLIESKAAVVQQGLAEHTEELMEARRTLFPGLAGGLGEFGGRVGGDIAAIAATGGVAGALSRTGTAARYLPTAAKLARVTPATARAMGVPRAVARVAPAARGIVASTPLAITQAVGGPMASSLAALESFGVDVPGLDPESARDRAIFEAAMDVGLGTVIEAGLKPVLRGAGRGLRGLPVLPGRAAAEELPAVAGRPPAEAGRLVDLQPREVRQRLAAQREIRLARQQGLAPQPRRPLGGLAEAERAARGEVPPVRAAPEVPKAPKVEERPVTGYRAEKRRTLGADADRVIRDTEQIQAEADKIAPRALPSAEERAAQVRGPRYRGGISLLGRKLPKPNTQNAVSRRGLARLLGSFRNPRYEQAHVVILDGDGKIIGHDVISSGAIDYGVYRPRDLIGLDDNGRVYGNLARRLDRMPNARQVVLAHNHPSGSAMHSPSDLKMLADTDRAMVAFSRDRGREVYLAGQIVIDGDTMSFGWVDDATGQAQHIEEAVSIRQAGQDWQSGVTLTSPRKIAEHVGPYVRNSDPNTIHVAYLDSQNRVVAVEPHSPAAIERIDKWFGQRARGLGAFSAALVTGSDDSYMQAVRHGTRMAPKNLRDIVQVTPDAEGGLRSLFDIPGGQRILQEPMGGAGPQISPLKGNVEEAYRLAAQEFSDDMFVGGRRLAGEYVITANDAALMRGLRAGTDIRELTRKLGFANPAAAQRQVARLLGLAGVPGRPPVGVISTPILREATETVLNPDAKTLRAVDSVNLLEDKAYRSQFQQIGTRVLREQPAKYGRRGDPLPKRLIFIPSSRVRAGLRGHKRGLSDREMREYLSHRVYGEAGTADFDFVIFDPATGRRIGSMGGTYDGRSKVLKIGGLYSSLDSEAGPMRAGEGGARFAAHTFGDANIRRLVKYLQRFFPEAQAVKAQRTSGPHGGEYAAKPIVPKIGKTLKRVTEGQPRKWALGAELLWRGYDRPGMVQGRGGRQRYIDWLERAEAWNRNLPPDHPRRIPVDRANYTASKKLYRKMLAASMTGEMPGIGVIYRAMNEGYEASRWYDEFIPNILPHIGNRPDAEMFARIFAVTSQLARFGSRLRRNDNIDLARRAFAIWKTGDEVEVDRLLRVLHGDRIGARGVPAGELSDLRAIERMVSQIDDFPSVRAVRRNLARVFRGQPVKGRKISNFTAALLGDKNAVVVDRWIARFFFGKTQVTDTEYDFIEQVIRRAAREYNIEPRQLQAAIWDTMRKRADPNISLDLRDVGDSAARAIKTRIQRFGSLRRWLESEAGFSQREIMQSLAGLGIGAAVGAGVAPEGREAAGAVVGGAVGAGLPIAARRLRKPVPAAPKRHARRAAAPPNEELVTAGMGRRQFLSLMGRAGVAISLPSANLLRRAAGAVQPSGIVELGQEAAQRRELTDGIIWGLHRMGRANDEIARRLGIDTGRVRGVVDRLNRVISEAQARVTAGQAAAGQRPSMRQRPPPHPRPRGQPRGVPSKVQLNKFGLSQQGQAKIDAEKLRLETGPAAEIPPRTVSHREQMAVARSLGMEDIERAHLNDQMDGSTMLAIRNVYRTNEEALVRAYNDLKQITHGPPPTQVSKRTVSDVDRLQRQIAAIEAEQAALLKTFIPKASQFGRDLNSLKIMARRSLAPESSFQWIVRAQRLAGRDLLPDERLQILKFLQRRDRPGLIGFMGKLIPPTRTLSLAGANQIRRAGLLTGLRTQARNFLSNTGELTMRTVDNPAAALADRVASRITGKRTIVTVNPLSRVRASARGAARSFGRNGTMMMAMRGQMDRGMLTKLDLHREVNLDNRFADAYVKFMFRLQGAADQPFRQAAFMESLFEQARTMGVNRGLRGKALTDFTEATVSGSLKSELGALPDDMVLQAIIDSEEAVFQNPSLFGSIVSGARARARQLGARPGVAGQAGRIGEQVITFVVPFSNTPGAVLGRLIERTPIGMLGSMAGMAQLAKAADNGIDERTLLLMQRDLAKRFGRSATGTLAILLGMHFANKGLASGRWPETTSEARDWLQEGKPEDAVLVKLPGEDKARWRQLTGISPIGNLIAIGAQLTLDAEKDDYQPADTISFAESAKRMAETLKFSVKPAGQLAAAETAGRTILEQSFLRGVNDVIQLFGRGRGGRTKQQVGARIAGSVVPIIVQDFARAIDPVIRKPQTLGEGIKARVPFWSLTVPARLDPLGRVMVAEPETRATRVFDPFLSRAPLAERDPQGYLREFERTGFTMPGMKKTSGETDAAFRERQIKYGEETREALDLLLQNRVYQRADTETQKEMLGQTVRRVRGEMTRRGEPKSWRAIVSAAIRSAR